MKSRILDKSNESIACGIARLKVSVKRWEENPPLGVTPPSVMGTLALTLRKVSYLIKSGSISVLANNIEVAVLGSGEAIGEMALIEGETRSATALLREDSQLFRLSSTDFNKLLNSYSSITISLLKTLSQRLRIRAAKAV